MHYNVTIFLLVFNLQIIICFRAHCLCVMHDLRCRRTNYIPTASQRENSSWQARQYCNCTLAALQLYCNSSMQPWCDWRAVVFYYFGISMQWECSSWVVFKNVHKSYRIHWYSSQGHWNSNPKICCVVQKHCLWR